jgi:ubiquinone/menaquinone biosynthesis C-methylase UbiE
MPVNFYDKVAIKFGGYGYGNGNKIKYISEYPAGDPEKIFKEKLLELSSINKIALDIGCADGKFTLSVAPFFHKIYGIDISKVNLDIAKSHSSDKRIKNVEYFFQNASHTLFKDSFFNLAYCRRGPSVYPEIYRLIKTLGYFVEIKIGEKDCQEIKEIFGRGQDFGKWNTSRLIKDTNFMKDLGFEIIFAKDYFYVEYYKTYTDLDLFLQGVPIFEDFDSKKDKKYLNDYISKFKTNKGIKLLRHRIVIIAKKS